MRKLSSLGHLAACLAAISGLNAQVTVLKNVDLIDGAGGAKRGVSIVIAGGRIRSIGPAAQVKAPAGANVVDLSGKTVMPGIMNLHGHVGLVKGLTQARENYTRENIEAQLRNYASYGVTSVVSMGSDIDPELMIQIRDEERGGRLNGRSRVFTAGRGFTAQNGYPAVLPGNKGVPFEVATAAQARAYVDQMAKLRVDLIKMWVDDELGRYPKLTPEVYSAIIDQAHRHKLKAAAHMFYLADAKRLVDAGVDALAHSVRDTDVDDELIARMKKHHTVQIPTLTREQSTFVYAGRPAWLDDPFFTRAVSAETIATLKSDAYRSKIAGNPDFEKYQQFFETASRNLKRLHDAGVRIGFGTDTGPPARFQGFFEHWEMELMVRAGMTPAEVIQAASKTAAEYLGVSRDLGTLEKGKYADLIVLDKSPLEDIRNTRTIHSVYLGGQRLP
jgi:imidazolonepropionase-like amidohydrolase